MIYLCSQTADTAEEALIDIAVALTKPSHVPYSFKLFIILNQEPPNSLSSYLSNQRGKILNTSLCIVPFFPAPGLSLNLGVLSLLTRENMLEWKCKSFWTQYFWTIMQNVSTAVPHTNTSLWMCQHSVLQLKYQGFLFVPKQSQRLRWKWLNYKQHFGLSRFYIKRKTA